MSVWNNKCSSFFGGRQLIKRIHRSLGTSSLSTESTTERTSHESYWKNHSNQKDFFDRLAVQLKVKILDDWYSITRKDILRCGGSPLLHRHGGSMSKALQAVYPEHNW